MFKTGILVVSHAVVGLIGFALGIYLLPILIAPSSPTQKELESASSAAVYQGQFRRDLADSDALHWGEGTVNIGAHAVAFRGELAPGPDYQLYFSPKFIETESDFLRLKPSMAHVGPVKTFSDFLVPIPAGIDPSDYAAVIVWCETFGQFITAATYQ